MNPLIPFSIPVSGLRLGTYHYEFELDREFFACFENSQIGDSSIRVKLDFEKQTTMYVLEFQLEGKVHAVCDRCLGDFWLPIEHEQRLTVKFDAEERDEAEVVYILPETKTLSVARYVYEFAHLALPLTRTHDAAGEACEAGMLDILEKGVGSSDNSEAPAQGENPWDVLKKLKTD